MGKFTQLRRKGKARVELGGASLPGAEVLEAAVLAGWRRVVKKQVS